MSVTKRSMFSDFTFVLLLGALGVNAWTIKQVQSLQDEVSKLSNPFEYDKLVESSMARIQQQKFAAQATKNLAEWETSSDAPTADRIKLYGNPSARFTITEYSDLECPYCRNFHATPKYLVDNSKGNVNWQWKHLPLSFHEPAATQGALASECVYDQKGSRGFWAFTDQWFKLSQGNGKGTGQPITEVAASVGVDIEVFDACLANAEHQGTINEQKEYGAKIGITGTPASMIVDNLTGQRVFVKGGQPVANLAKAINELAKQPPTGLPVPALAEVEQDRLAISGQQKPVAAPSTN
ncbi:DSBA-like thioredoxin domain protein [compost metagenome]